MGVGYQHDPNCVSPKMTSGTAPSPNVVTESGYSGSQPGWKVFKQLGNADPWWINSTASPQWIKLDTGEGNSLTINAYSMTSNSNNQNYPGMPREWTLEGSNNGTDWTTIENFATLPDGCENSSTRRFFLSAPVTYRLFKFTFTLKDSGGSGWQIDEIELINTTDTGFTHNANCVHEAMTDYNVPSPQVVTEGNYTGVYRGWHAFDRYAVQMMPFYYNYQWGTWVKMDLGTAKVVNQYTVTSSRNDASYPGMPKSFTLEGSNNDSDFTPLDTQTNLAYWLGATMRTFTFVNTTAYRYYRLSPTAMEDNATSIQIDEIELIYNPPELMSSFWPAIMRLLDQ